MSTLQITESGPVIQVVLNRPDVRNAFNEALIGELTAWAQRVGGKGSARVAVLSGAGKVFCAGADLMWMTKMVDYSAEENVRDARALAGMFQALNDMPIPLVGRIHGAALGGGAGLAAVCDVVVAADDAIFGFTEAKLGILPAVISPFTVAKIGQSAARELFLTGARFSAERAREIGLIHSVVPSGSIDAALETIVNELLTSGPEAIAGVKALIANIANKPPTDVTQLTAETIARHRVSREGQEGMRAFLEKRKAPWAQ
jgi:methylglutaconyl-CoA hydratase